MKKILKIKVLICLRNIVSKDFAMNYRNKIYIQQLNGKQIYVFDFILAEIFTVL